MKNVKHHRDLPDLQKLMDELYDATLSERTHYIVCNSLSRLLGRQIRAELIDRVTIARI